MGNPARPRGFKVGRRPTAASRKDHGGGGVRQPRGDHSPARALLPPAAVPAPGLIPPASAPTTEAPAPGLIPPASAPTTEAPVPVLLPPPSHAVPELALLPPPSPTTPAPGVPPPSHAVPELALLPPPSPTTPAPDVPPPDWVPWYMAPASWYMTHERAHLTTPPAPALLLPSTAPSTATSEPCNHNGMLLGPRVNVRDPSPPAAPASSITTPAFRPPPTANPTAMKKGILGWAGSLDLKVMEEEPEGSKDSMGEDDEADIKAAWCYGA